MDATFDIAMLRIHIHIFIIEDALRLLGDYCDGGGISSVLFLANLLPSSLHFLLQTLQFVLSRAAATLAKCLSCSCSDTQGVQKIHTLELAASL